MTPKCDPLDPQAQKMALRGLALLKNAPIFSSLSEAVADCRHVVATCGRLDHGDIPLDTPESVIQWLSDGSEIVPTALVFGREDRGLSNKELLMAQRVISIHTEPDCPSLNLSHAVAVVLYQLHSHEKRGSPKNQIKSEQEPALSKQMEDFLKDTENLLLEIGFIFRHTSTSRMAKIRALLHRADARSNEIALLRGILRQVRWAMKSNRS